MAEQIHVMEIECDQCFAQICRQAGDAVAARGIVRFTAAAVVEGENAPVLRQGANPMLKFRRALRPAMQHHKRLAFSHFLITQAHPAGDSDRLVGDRFHRFTSRPAPRRAQRMIRRPGCRARSRRRRQAFAR